MKTSKKNRSVLAVHEMRTLTTVQEQNEAT